MKVAHWGVFAPCQSGQYETAKELIIAERAAGLDAEFIDFGWKDQANCRVGLVDGAIKTVNPHWCDDANIMLRHSDIPLDYLRKDIPYMICLHGRPESSFLTGYRSGAYPVDRKKDVFKMITDKVLDKNCLGYITFWQEYMEMFEDLVPSSLVHYVPAPVDLIKYTPFGTKRKFENSGEPNIIITDMWREDITPFNVLQAALYYKRHINSKASIHIYGIWKNDYRRDYINKYGKLIGECMKFVTGLEFVYRSADIFITPHVIATRTVREAMASGVPMVAGGGSPYTQYNHDPRDIKGFAQEIDKCWQETAGNNNVRLTIRKQAEEEFSLERVGRMMKGTLEFSLNSEVMERMHNHKVVEQVNEICAGVR